MRKTTAKSLTLILVMASMLLGACSSMDCSINSIVRCNYRFMNSNGEEIKMKGFLSVSIPRDKAGLDDTTLVNKQENPEMLSLPMSYAQDEDELHFLYTTELESELGIMDVVKISKDNEPVFESVECPARFNHVLKSVSSTHNFIDSVVINNNKVTNDALQTHIYIYLHTTAE